MNILFKLVWFVNLFCFYLVFVVYIVDVKVYVIIEIITLRLFNGWVFMFLNAFFMFYKVFSIVCDVLSEN